MPVSEPRLMTAEEFGRMPGPDNDALQELVRGVVETMPPHRPPHGFTCAILGSLLHEFVQSIDGGLVTSNNVGVVFGRNPDTVRGPDISFWSRPRHPGFANEYTAIAPDLAVEVLSPEDTASRFLRKLGDYSRAQVTTVWIIDPELRTATVICRSAVIRTLEESDTLEGEGPLAGFSCRVGDLFA